MRAARNPPPRLTNMDFCEFRALWIPAFAGMTVKNRQRRRDNHSFPSLCAIALNTPTRPSH